MARPKSIAAAPLDTGPAELLKKIEAACGTLTDIAGKPLPYNPVVQLAIFASKASDADDGAMKKLRLDAAKEVAKYTNVQIRAQEHTGPGGGDLVIKILKANEV